MPFLCFVSCNPLTQFSGAEVVIPGIVVDRDVIVFAVLLASEVFANIVCPYYARVNVEVSDQLQQFIFSAVDEDAVNIFDGFKLNQSLV